MEHFPSNNENLRKAIETIVDTDKPSACLVSVLDFYSMNYTLTLNVNDKSTLEVRIQFPLFDILRSSQSSLEPKLKVLTVGALSSFFPSSLKSVITFPEVKAGALTLSINLKSLRPQTPGEAPEDPSFKAKREELKEYFADFTYSFQSALLLQLTTNAHFSSSFAGPAQPPCTFSLVPDRSSLLFVAFRDQKLLISFGFKEKTTLSSFLLKSLATAIETKLSKGSSVCPPLFYYAPTEDQKSEIASVLRTDKAVLETVKNGFLLFMLSLKKEDLGQAKCDCKEVFEGCLSQEERGLWEEMFAEGSTRLAEKELKKVKQCLRMKVYTEFQMKGGRIVMNERMREMGRELKKVLNRASVWQ